MLNKIAVAMAIIVCAVGAGCQSHAESKKSAEMRFRKASTQIKLNLAQQQYEENRFDEAKRTISECINEDPWIPQAHLLFGKLLLIERQRDEATNELTLALELDEKLADGWYWLGLASEEKGDYQQAHECYSKAINLAPRNVDYILAVAEMYAVQDKHEQAIQLLEERIEAVPEEVSLKIAAAELMFRMGRNEQAIKLYKQAMLITDDDETIAESFGYCYLFSGKWSEAAEIFNKLAVQCRDEQKKKLYLQAAALSSMNCAQYGRAVNCYNELSVVERSSAEIWVKMGQAALGTGAAGRAFVCGQKALALQPGCADAIALIGCAQYAGGVYELAAKSFEKIASDDKNGGFSWMMRARCYEQLGKTKKAEWAYKRAIEMNPHSELGDFLARGKRKFKS